jgi:hypothetical protein
VYTIYVNNIKFYPGFMEFKRYGGLCVCDSVSLKVIKNMSVREWILERVYIIVPVFVGHNEYGKGIWILLGC